MALGSFPDTSALSRAYSTRARQRVDPNPERVAHGAVNRAAGLFQGLPVSSSPSRPPVPSPSRCYGCSHPNRLRNLLDAALAAVVVASCLDLVEVADLRRIHRMARGEFWLSMAYTTGVVLLRAIPGIALGLAIMGFLWHA